MPALLSHAWYGMGNVCNVREQYDKALYYLTKANRCASWRPDILYSMEVA